MAESSIGIATNNLLLMGWNIASVPEDLIDLTGQNVAFGMNNLNVEVVGNIGPDSCNPAGKGLNNHFELGLNSVEVGPEMSNLTIALVEHTEPAQNNLTVTGKELNNGIALGMNSLIVGLAAHTEPARNNGTGMKYQCAGIVGNNQEEEVDRR